MEQCRHDGFPSAHRQASGTRGHPAISGSRSRGHYANRALAHGGVGATAAARARAVCRAGI